MKKLLLSSSIAAFFTMLACQTAFSQQSNSIINRGCGTMENLELLKQQDPGLESRMQQLEEQTQAWIKNNPSPTSVVINIPIVFHVVWNTTAENVSDACINAQLAVINADFRKLNADWTKVTQPGWPALVADTEIQFCLATVDPSGAPTTGITRTQTTTTSFSTNNNVKYTANGGKNVWDRTKYLNAWVCDLGGGLLGYAQFPGGAAATDGVVQDYQYMVGSAGCGTAPYNYGRTLTHEIGHFLGLYHIWGDDAACTGSDQVANTPNQDGENYTCWAAGAVKISPEECTAAGADGSPASNVSPGYMWMNYMDYTDDFCMYMFTTGQKTRITAAMNGTTRVGLKTSAATNCAIGTGVVENVLSDNISLYPNPSTGEVFISTNVNIMDIKVYNAIGEVVITKKINASSGETKINLNNNPDGIYLFEVKTSEGTITKKVVINR